uniref:Ycf34 n=1 Tax=Gracilaria vermiculophylla TaxID=2608709 RepID=A0A345U8W2_9FLOR|nr:hypothetical protein [Gracilaria vermiculophylla]AXI96898.1 hypothetical protein [Gracilaria vermiculophylla]QXU75109.1 hypothetical protein [Gracilaria vermiculophylla]WDZ68039.1 hypothetical protein [Gracilaria vermiculophylla]
MCICVNCRHVHNCTAYYLIQKQHNSVNDKKNINKFFIPEKTLINISINYIDTYMYFDWDLVECLSFIEMPGNWIV